MFISDDNLTVHRARAKELLEAIRDWNERQTDGRMHFATQLSIDTAKDDELLRLCAEAGLGHVFIGLETPNEESLREAKKRQNVGVDLVAQVRRIQEHGIMVMGGMVVGFDSDGPDIFDRQYQFATAAALPIVTLGPLVAPFATPLHERLKREGRLVENEGQVEGVPWATNILPKRMTREDLLLGIERLSRRLYSPAAFGERLLRYIDVHGAACASAHAAVPPGGPVRSVDEDVQRVVESVAHMGPDEATMVGRVMLAVRDKPQIQLFVVASLRVYAQIRYMADHARSRALVA